jgi:uncharacterized protein YeaO (DUF488 family)
VTAEFPILLARVYDPAEAGAGARLLVDRLWPRGMAKAALHLDDWPKAVAPSTALRQWFHATPGNWPEFRHRYETELAAEPQAVEQCLTWCRRGPVTLLTATRDRTQSHAIILRDWLLARL